MNGKNNKIRAKVIRETFHDTSKIERPVSAEELNFDENITHDGDIFMTEDGEFIDLELQKKDFDEDELLRYVELAEDIYEKHHKKVSVYVICPDNIDVYVREFDIKSDADFTIKLAKIEENTAEIILNMIKRKIMNREMLDEDDLNALEMLPAICEKEKKHYYRLEVFKIKNRFLY